jgi:hypothetical protein
MGRRLALSTAAVALLATAALLLLGAPGRDDRADYVTEHPVAVPEAVRTVNVSRSMPMPSAHPRRLSAMLEAGSLPGGVTTGEVVSDTECTPDADMVSHCRNEIRLADGHSVVLRHPHDMREVPCLAPGEQVRLVTPEL